MSKLPGLILISVLLMLAIASATRISYSAAPQAAPDFSLSTLDGRAIKLSELRGHVVLISFWATWCRPCLEELPVLERLYRKYRDRGLRILSISIDRVVENAEKQIAKTPISYPVLSDPSGEVFIDKYEVNALPATFLVDRSGILVYKHFGLQDMESGGFIKKLESLLEEEKKSEP